MNKKERAFWGVYFNIAAHDFERTLERHLDKKKFTDPKSFLRCFKKVETKTKKLKGGREEKYEKVTILKKDIQAFKSSVENKKRFPFFEPVSKECKNKQGEHIENAFCDLEHYHEKFYKLYEVLYKLRNHYSHLHTVPPTILTEPTDEEKAFIRALQFIYDGAVDKVKDRFQLDEKKIERYRRTQPGKPKEGQSNYKTNAEFKWKLDDEKGRLNTVGQAFLACLCMQKRFRGNFFEGLKKWYHTKEFIYTQTFRRICDALAIRVPNPKIQSEQTDFQFGMDILGTLRKCPDVLFEHIQSQEQEKFRIQNEQGEEVLLKRNDKNHKFEDLTLQYLERLECFKKVGIFTYMGNYYSHCYDKGLIDGEKEKRTIHRRAYALWHLFGEKGLQQYLPKKDENDKEIKERKKRKDITAKISAEEPKPFKPYLSKVHPKYIINQNKIGFAKINLRQTQGSKFMLPAVQENGKLKNPEPQVWLSKNELPALVFYAYLLEQDKKDLPRIEKLLFEHTFQEAPAKKHSGNADRILNRIKKYIAESEGRRKQVEERKYIAYGKKQYRSPIKDGQMASWLASDMMKLQPSKKAGRDKITGANYTALQRSLAISDSENWERVFNGAKLLNGEIAHPFLRGVMDCYPKSVGAFYKKYLSERIAYFERWKNEVDVKKAEGISNINFNDVVFQKLFRKHLMTKNTTNEKFLPRGIFKESIIDWFEKHGSEQMKNIVKGEVNVSYIIKKYFQIDEKDSLPKVYRLPRHYKFLDNFYNYKEYLDSSNLKNALKTKKPPAPKENQTNKEVLKKWRQYKAATKNEDRIRLWGVQDRLLFLMSKKVMPEDMVKNKDYKLSKIDVIFNTKTDFSFKGGVKDKGEVTYEFKNKPLKEYGQVYQYKTDGRIHNLSTLLYKEGAENIFSEQDLADEFTNYEKYRLEVFEKAFEMEQQFLKENPQELEKLGKIDHGWEWHLKFFCSLSFLL